MITTPIQATDVCLSIEHGKLIVTFTVPVETVKQKAISSEIEMPRLTRREQETFDGVCNGKTNKEIAATLNLSERTVKFHVSSLLTKFNCHSRIQIATLGARS